MHRIHATKHLLMHTIVWDNVPQCPRFITTQKGIFEHAQNVYFLDCISSFFLIVDSANLWPVLRVALDSPPVIV